MQVGFPQKSSFGTLTATKIICPEYDTVAADVQFKRNAVAIMSLRATEVYARKHLKLATDQNLTDESGNALLSGDNAGKIDAIAAIIPAVTMETSLAVPEVHTPTLDNPAGDLAIKRTGVTSLLVNATRINLHKSLKHTAGRAYIDVDGNVIFGTDDLAHFDQFGRMDAALTTPAGSHSILSSPAPLVPLTQSGTINETTGYWEATADDVLYLFLDPLLGRLGLNAEIHIDTIKVYYRTFHNDAYVDFGRVHRRSMATSGTAMIGDNSTNNGSGNTAQSNFTISVDSLMSAGYTHFMEISVEATAGDVWILGIEVNYHTV